MAQYQLIDGKSSLPMNGPNKPETTFREGDTVETDLPLDEMWPHKWVKVSEEQPARSPRGRKAAAPKAAAAKAPPPPSEEEDEEDEDGPEGDDVTDDFELAADNDLKVMHVTGSGYTVFEGKKALNNEPIRTKPQTLARIKDHVGEK